MPEVAEEGDEEVAIWLPELYRAFPEDQVIANFDRTDVIPTSSWQFEHFYCIEGSELREFVRLYLSRL